jgi:L(+)-tartrate dehydratase beta subunit
MRDFGAVHLAVVGGTAALSTLQIEQIEEVRWEGSMPQYLWKFRVRAFGPLILAIDAHSNSLYDRVREQAALLLKSSWLF